MDTREVIANITEMTGPILEEEGVELVEVEFIKGQGRAVLRIFVDKMGGISLDECQTISHRINYLLEVEDFPLGSYVLEVSSPGIFCTLKRPADFRRNIGKRALVTMRSVEAEKTIQFHGTLESCSDETVSVQTEDGRSMDIGFEQIELARLDPILFPNAPKEKKRQRKGKKWARK